VVGVDEADKTRSGPIASSHPALPKTRQRNGLRPSARRDEAYLMLV
jgi:hypothetical protein